MKNLIDNFRKFLKEGQLSDYDDNGEVRLYHYMDLGYGEKPETVVIDPSRFGQASYSRNEKQRSNFPRSFFYLHPRQRERMVAAGKALYTTQVPAASLYDFREDHLGYDRVKSEEHPNGLIDPDTPTQRLYMGDDEHSWGDLFRKVSEDYEGMFYSLRSFDVVVLFKPIEASLVPAEDRDALEK